MVNRDPEILITIMVSEQVTGIKSESLTTFIGTSIDSPDANNWQFAWRESEGLSYQSYDGAESFRTSPVSLDKPFPAEAGTWATAGKQRHLFTMSSVDSKLL